MERREPMAVKNRKLPDLPKGEGSMSITTVKGQEYRMLAVTDTEYIPYHICRNVTVLHKIYLDAEHPSHVLLPVIPNK